MIIKVCGMRDSENIRQLAKLNVDYMGFIFYPLSKRFVGIPDKNVLTSLPASIKKTGVFVDTNIEVIADKVSYYQLDAVQLHGAEPPEFCRSLSSILQNEQRGKKIELIKAFGLFSEFNFNDLNAYQDEVDYFLFDTKTSYHGGSGITFDWNILKEYAGQKPYFLSGGLSAKNMAGIIDFADRRLYGVDLNSRFETETGIKDISKLEAAFQLIRDQKYPIDQGSE